MFLRGWCCVYTVSCVHWKPGEWDRNAVLSDKLPCGGGVEPQQGRAAHQTKGSLAGRKDGKQEVPLVSVKTRVESYIQDRLNLCIHTNREVTDIQQAENVRRVSLQEVSWLCAGLLYEDHSQQAKGSDYFILLSASEIQFEILCPISHIPTPSPGNLYTSNLHIWRQKKAKFFSEGYSNKISSKSHS